MPSQPLWPHLMSDVGLESRGNFNRTALVTTVSCNNLLLHNVLGSSYVRQLGFLSHWDPYNVISLEVVAYSSYCNTLEWFLWNWNLSQRPTGFLQWFDTFGWPIMCLWKVKSLFTYLVLARFASVSFLHQSSDYCWCVLCVCLAVCL